MVFNTLILMISLSFMNFASAQTSITGSTSMEVYDQDGLNNKFLTMYRPSCDMVKHRLQEFFTRTSEAEHLLNWYSPERIGEQQNSELLNLLRRTPRFMNERIYENVRVFYFWKLSQAEFASINGPIIGKQIISGKLEWTDNYNGTLPEDVSLKIVERDKVIIFLSLDMSYETFCLENPNLTLILQGKGQRLFLTAVTNPEDL